MSAARRILIELVTVWARIRRSRRVVAFVFHGIGENSPVSVDRGEYERKIAYIRQCGLRITSVQGGLRALAEGRGAVVLTFDDAYENIAEHLERLIDAGESATVYVPTGYVGARNEWDRKEAFIPCLSIMRRDRIAELSKRGIEFGTHTVLHASLGAMTREQGLKEAIDSRRDLASVLSSDVQTFSYPYGEAPTEAVGAVRDAGYSAAVSTRWSYWMRESDLHRLGRFSGNLDFPMFRLVLHGGYDLYKRVSGLLGSPAP